MSDINMAREWVKIVGKVEDLMPAPRAAVEIIQSLPDEWIDAKKVRELLDRWEANPSLTWDEGVVLNDVEALLAPSLPTLADMPPEERKACLWMQAKIHRSEDLEGVIFSLTDYRVKVMFRDGTFVTQDHDEVTPLPDLPKLEWPGSTPDDVAHTTGGVLTTQDVCNCRYCNSEENSLPRPEDVPAEEAWLVKHDWHDWVGTRGSREEVGCAWALARLDGEDYTVAGDDEITLVSRLVPEVTP